MLAIDNQEILNLPFVRETIQLAKDTVAAAHRPGIGITSCASDGIFANTIWARDSAVISLVSDLFPEELITTIATLIHHQDESGVLPIRVQQVDVFWSYVLGFLHLEKCLKKTDISPWYEYSKRAVPARDTVYYLIISYFNLYRSGAITRELAEKMIPCLVKALETEERHVDPVDQLVISRPCSNWGDCLKQKGKLASINLPRYQALRIMSLLVRENKGLSNQYSRQTKDVLSSCNQTLWDDSRGCFTVSAEDRRLDTLTNILACFWLKDLDQCARIQDSLERETRDNISGLLKCYSRPYAWHEISLLRTVGMTGYGNTFFYPLISDLNVLAQVRIASSHPDPLTRIKFIQRAQARFVNQTTIHFDLGTFHEVLKSPSRPARHPFFPRQFKSHSDFTPAAATYLAAALALSNFQAP